MHKLSIPQSIIDRTVERRGREHVYDDLDPRRTALIAASERCERIAAASINPTPC